MSMVQPREASAPPSLAYREASIAVRFYSSDALQSFDDVFAIDEVDPDPSFPGEIGRYLAQQRRWAVCEELARRERLAVLNTSLPSPSDRRYQEWRELAQLVRERVDILEVFSREGYLLHDVGPREAHAACLICGGTDRLVIRRDPLARVWCRRCRWSTDVIGLTMSLRQEGFRDAVRWLAGLARQAVAA